MLYFNGAMSLDLYIGMLLFLFDLFVPIKTFYDQNDVLKIKPRNVLQNAVIKHQRLKLAVQYVREICYSVIGEIKSVKAL